MSYYIAKMNGTYLKVVKLDENNDIIESNLKPFSFQGFGDYDDFFMYNEEIVSKIIEKLRLFVAFRNRICN
jgi:hypothetical protein